METELRSVATTESSVLTQPLASNSVETRSVSKSSVAAYIELSKPRILILILLTAIAGFCLASKGSIDIRLLIHMNVGVGLLAAGIGALNQFFERDIDRLMRRTERRPLPSGRLTPTKACLFGIATSIGGILYIALLINLLSGIMGIFTLGTYIFLYTPLKRKTPLSTFIGAFPGAVPPLIGWTAVSGNIGIEAIVLFAIMFFWQFPHFHAIAWMYREDYARAGIRMLPVIEPDGRSTSRQIVFYALVLLPVSLLPFLIGLAGHIYLFGAFVLSLAYLYFGIRTAILRSRQEAKYLLQASVLYLPLLFALMLINKTAF
jgi:heme o synthase